MEDHPQDTQPESRPFHLPFLALALDPEPAHAELLDQCQGPYTWKCIEPHQGDALRARLAAPRDATLFGFHVWEPLGWANYRFSVWGTPAESTRHAETAPLFRLQVRTRPAPPWDNIPLVAWLRVVRWVGSPLRLEARWDPTSGLAIDLHGGERDQRKASWDHLWKGLRLLKAIEARSRGGREPLTTRHYTREQFHAVHPTKYAEAHSMRRGPRVVNKDLARAYGVSLSTYQRYLREYGHPTLP